MKCKKCKKDFMENQIDLSHNIPKYMGGKDIDGRTYLCKKCHNEYELTILIKCLKKLGIEINPEKDRIYYMALIKNLDDYSKRLCIKIAKEIKEEFFNG